MNDFVNPYTFVPFPEIDDWAAIRSVPAGHDRLLDGRYSGRIEVKLTTRSPLLIRGIRPGEEESPPPSRGGAVSAVRAGFVPGRCRTVAARDPRRGLPARVQRPLPARLSGCRTCP